MGAFSGRICEANLDGEVRSETVCQEGNGSRSGYWSCLHNRVSHPTLSREKNLRNRPRVNLTTWGKRLRPVTFILSA